MSRRFLIVFDFELAKALTGPSLYQQKTLRVYFLVGLKFFPSAFPRFCLANSSVFYLTFIDFSTSVCELEVHDRLLSSSVYQNDRVF